MSTTWPPATSLRTFRQTLTASGNFTVPAGVTLLAVRCVGGGGAGGGSGGGGGTQPTSGGTTTFSTVVAFGGDHGASATGVAAFTSAARGAFGPSGKGGGAGCGNTGSGLYSSGSPGLDGYVAGDTLVVTPGAVIAYTVGGGGTVGNATTPGGAGGPGYVEVEWQA